MRLLESDQISYTQRMVAKPHKSAKRSYRYVKQLYVLNSARQNSNRSSNFSCNWTSFHSNNKENKNADMRV